MDVVSARKLLEEGRFAEAEVAYRQLVDNPAQRTEALYGLGLVSFNSKQFATAEEWFVRSLEASPRNEKKNKLYENSLFYLGLIAEKKADSGAAVGLYGEVLSLNPEHGATRARLSQLLAAGALHPHREEPSPEPKRDLGPPKREREWSQSIVGLLTDVSRRQESFANSPGGVQIIDLRLQGYENGLKTQQYSVSLRGRRIKGAIPQVGDWLEIEPKFDKSGSLRPTKLRNLVTGELVSIPWGFRA